MSLLRRTRNSAVLAVTVLCLAVTGASLMPTHAADGGNERGRVAAALPAPLDTRPNILLISTDDQTVSDLRRMPQTRRLIGGAGATFTDMLSPHPLCCPARAEILTGQYTHNNGVRSNNSKWHGGHPYLRPSQTIATWLQSAGYATAMVGKYLNQYGAGDGREPGWDIWNPTIRKPTSYYGYTMYNDGDPKTYDDIHNVDLVGDKTVDYIGQLSAEGRPFFLWSSHVAPHMVCGGREGRGRCNGIPPVPSRHHGKFKKANSPSLKKPSFNEKKMSDKPKFLRKKHKVRAAEVNRIHRARIRSLLAVDEAVAAAVGELRRTGELDNTLILFTSDNGYLLGEHRYISKDVPYEEALGVPLLMRGPGVPTGVTRKQTVTMVDLAATFMDAANAAATLPLDGRSILPVAAGRSSGAQTVLIQSGPTRKSEIRVGWSYRGVRTARYTYVRWLATGFVELYDRAKDPFQMRNVAHDRDYKSVRKGLAKRYQQLRSCAGATCRTVFPALPPPRH